MGVWDVDIYCGGEIWDLNMNLSHILCKLGLDLYAGRAMSFNTSIVKLKGIGRSIIISIIINAAYHSI